MRQWSEGEVFSFLAEHLRRAADECAALAVNRRKGPIYNALRHDLRLIEDMCRIVHYMRQDARWLQHGLRCSACHRTAGDWLRGVPRKPGPDGRPRPAMMIPEGVKHPLFIRMSEYLINMKAEIEAMRHARTGRTGMILPRMLEPPGVRLRPVTVKVPHFDQTPEETKTDGGVILEFKPKGADAA